MANLEQRLAALETKVSAIEERRRRLIPAELDANPNVQTVLRDGMDAFTAKMRLFAEQRVVDEATTRFNEAKLAANKEFERLVLEGKQAELAKDVAAIEFFEKNGFSPPGYEITEKIPEK